MDIEDVQPIIIEKPCTPQQLMVADIKLENKSQLLYVSVLELDETNTPTGVETEHPVIQYTASLDYETLDVYFDEEETELVGVNGYAMDNRVMMKVYPITSKIYNKIQNTLLD